MAIFYVIFACCIFSQLPLRLGEEKEEERRRKIKVTTG